MRLDPSFSNPETWIWVPADADAAAPGRGDVTLPASSDCAYPTVIFAVKMSKGRSCTSEASVQPAARCPAVQAELETYDGDPIIVVFRTQTVDEIVGRVLSGEDVALTSRLAPGIQLVIHGVEPGHVNRFNRPVLVDLPVGRPCGKGRRRVGDVSGRSGDIRYRAEILDRLVVDAGG